MSGTIIVTRNVSDRIRGFLASSMLEVGPGVYCGVRMSPAVRDRVWGVLEEWFAVEQDASIVMVWREPSLPGEQSIRVLGVPPVDLVEHDGMILARRPARTDVEEGQVDGDSRGHPAGPMDIRDESGGSLGMK